MNRRIALPALLFATTTFAHDAPNPVIHWDFNPKFLQGQTLVAQRGPNLEVLETKQLVATEIANRPSLAATGRAALLAEGGSRDLARMLPT